jgi:intron-binding protein aquarius
MFSRSEEIRLANICTHYTENFTRMVELGKPNLGEDRLSKVTADVTFNVRKYTDAIQMEWEAIREHDILFLLTIEAHESMGEQWDGKGSFRKHYGLKHVRGCEVVSVIGPNGKPFDYKKSDPQMIQEHRTGNTRTFRVALDPNQYKIDQDLAKKNGGQDIYQTFNIVLRRKPDENNFKPVLETIRDLMQNDLMIPDWLHDVFLGYGNPNSAHYSQLKKQVPEIDFRDTFLDLDHLKSSFPGMTIKAKDGDEDSLSAPFVVRFPDAPEEASSGSKKKKGAEKASKGKGKAQREGQAQDELIVNTYTTPNMGPYPEDVPNTNQIRFTSTQVEAIKAGTNPGLTMVVGPPGTGKTDVAVQIIANLYNNFPNQHTLLVTHSNQALNQLFEKIIALDVDERHLLRLGHGEEELNTELSFSKYGRVTSFLEKRVNLLAEVDRLAQSLEIGGEHGSTCETAGYFNSYHVIPIWEKYEQQVKDATNAGEVQTAFPFHLYFSNSPTPLFSGCSTAEEALEVSRGCFRHLKKLFEQLEEVSAFELLRTSYDRANYLLTKEAKICTHAALKRRELVKLGFKYDNIVMEEAAQILEVETFIPMLLQEPEDGVNRLKRVILIGDHNQLPPVVKNTAFQQYGNMEQSMFTRFVRLGVPTVQLDAQGRARSEMAELYKWRYKELGDLPNVLEREEFKYANPGFKYDFQFVNVENFNGQGETAPRPHFIQNLGEAEYVVAVYQFMILMGYPREKITILTTYNGQKDLIRDVLKQRCSWNPLFGQPAAITTVDKYQGQQNDCKCDFAL